MRQPETSLTHEDIRGMCGDVADWKIAAIEASGANADELAAALAWVDGGDDRNHGVVRVMNGTASQLCDILAAGDDIWGEGRD
ncbi:hypothetical protein [Pseudokordiimonas caeni]|uniref:hypothetical protein n=1 Tax=Pseudokordiimonas caeni TaxID=2997908 RepID=UPI0028124D3B|nr:hypothetical protein [Pseudokordiimonas caeni]